MGGYRKSVCTTLNSKFGVLGDEDYVCRRRGGGPP